MDLKNGALVPLGGVLLWAALCHATPVQTSPPQYAPPPGPPYPPQTWRPGVSGQQPVATQECLRGNYACHPATKAWTACEFCEFDHMQYQCGPDENVQRCCGYLNANPLNDCGRVVLSACNVDGICKVVLNPTYGANHCLREFAQVVGCP